MDETKTGRDAAASSTSAAGDTGRAGFCQECGKPLTRETLKRVDNGVFCEPCASTRQTTPGWESVHANPSRHESSRSGESSRSSRSANVPPQHADAPNPAIAGVLGLIPGVGAMFNGQYAKSAMHLIVFVALVALADNLYWGFWWLVWGWIFYQAFEAYHTARARRDHMPLPNPFGWNEVGERMGFARTSQPPPVPFPLAEPYVRQTGPNWAGYIPPRESSAIPYSPFAASGTDNPYTAPYTPPTRTPVPPVKPLANVPYAPTYTGTVTGQAISPPVPLVGTRRFPVGAIWLIGLGVLFLMGNLLPGWRLSGHWFTPLLLAAIAFWCAFRRWELARSAPMIAGTSTNLAAAMVGPIMLLAVAALLALQAASVLAFKRSWPMLLVVWGMMLLLRRSAGTPLPHAAPEWTEAVPPPPVRSTSGTGSLGL